MCAVRTVGRTRDRVGAAGDDRTVPDPVSDLVPEMFALAQAVSAA